MRVEDPPDGDPGTMPHGLPLLTILDPLDPHQAWAALEYLPDLPFARADLIANRARVCDYCFFGGPTKDVPLIP